jgi:hypothetical protein
VFAKLPPALALLLAVTAGPAGALPKARNVVKSPPKTAAKAPPRKAAPSAAMARKPAPRKTEKAPAKLPRLAKAPLPDKALLAKTAPVAKPRPRENPYLEVPDRAFAESTLAFRYANLSDDDALAELRRRGIPWTPATPPMPGVRTPIRLLGPLHGVNIHSTLAEAARATSVFEILDARLAIALDDFTSLLAKHDVVEIVHYTMYRPPSELSADPKNQIRHPAGLAIDVGGFRKRDGRWLAVGLHWPSAIGQKTCGEGAREHWTREARELVSIVCEAKDHRLFHFMLTPDFDAAHADHLHLEIKPGARSFIVN